MITNEHVRKIFVECVIERPVGTENNHAVLAWLEQSMMAMGYMVEALPFDCYVWERGTSTLIIDDRTFDIEPNSFSEPFEGKACICVVDSAEKLRELDCRDAILVLTGALSQSPISPKNYPFYFPDEHRDLIALLEEKKPAAILGVTGATPLNGKCPFPLFVDGNFLIPSASVDAATYADIEKQSSRGLAQLTIVSGKKPSTSRQLIGKRRAGKSKGKIILGAHMDTQYDTPGALDNAVGVAVLLEIAEHLSISDYDIDIIPFNSEEYFAATGEMAYLDSLCEDKITLMINIDSPCHKDSQTALSFYNFNQAMQSAADRVIASSPRIVKGEEWYAGDHAPFLFRGVPCIAVASSDMSAGALANTHTPRDTMETVDVGLVEESARCICDMIIEYIKISN